MSPLRLDELPKNTSCQCPALDTWLNYAHGRLPDECIDDLSSHLDNCPVCLRVVTAIGEGTDTIVDLLGGQFNAYLSEASFHDLQHALSQSPRDLSRWSAADAEAAVERPLPAGIPRGIDEYRILEPLGDGAVGRVFKARHKRLEKHVAIKLLAPKRGLTSELVQRFEREMRAVGKITHPNVIGATDAGNADGYYFLVMHYLEGLDASRIVARLGRLPLAEACEVVRQAALGIQSAHDHGLIHRDVKPSNLLVADEGVVKVLDLGLVCLGRSGDEFRRDAGVVGTPYYMAPEQWRGELVDERADVYGLGATLFKLLSGLAPHERLRHHPDRQSLAGSELPPCTTENAELFCSIVPKELRETVFQALASRPQDRFATAGGFANAVQRWSERADLGGLVLRARAFTVSDTLHDWTDGETIRTEALPPTAPKRVVSWAIGGAAAILLTFLPFLETFWTALPSGPPLPEWRTLNPNSTETLWYDGGRKPKIIISQVTAMRISSSG